MCTSSPKRNKEKKTIDIMTEAICGIFLLANLAFLVIFLAWRIFFALSALLGLREKNIRRGKGVRVGREIMVDVEGVGRRDLDCDRINMDFTSDILKEGEECEVYYTKRLEKFFSKDDFNFVYPTRYKNLMLREILEELFDDFLLISFIIIGLYIIGGSVLDKIIENLPIGG